MTWRPTDGLKRSESVVQQILSDLVACGVPPITNPDARWRMKQVIAQALDGFGGTVSTREPEFPLEIRDGDDIAQLQNGSITITREVDGGYTEEEVYGTANVVTAAIASDDKPAKRRGRGRPKLSAAEKKKRKAAKQANAVEAEAAQ